MKEKMRTIGYLCPRCRKPVMQQRSRFALAESFVISPWALVPALIMLILPLLRVPIRLSLIHI